MFISHIQDVLKHDTGFNGHPPNGFSPGIKKCTYLQRSLMRELDNRLVAFHCSCTTKQNISCWLCKLCKFADSAIILQCHISADSAIIIILQAFVTSHFCWFQQTWNHAFYFCKRELLSKGWNSSGVRRIWWSQHFTFENNTQSLPGKGKGGGGRGEGGLPNFLVCILPSEGNWPVLRQNTHRLL